MEIPPKRLDRTRLGSAVRVGRNAPCPCGSGKKYKKCCLMLPISSVQPLPRKVKRASQRFMGKSSMSIPRQQLPTVVGNRKQVAGAMVQAGVPAAHIYAFLNTGVIIRPGAESEQPATVAEKWAQSITEFDQANEEQQAEMLRAAFDAAI